MSRTLPSSNSKKKSAPTKAFLMWFYKEYYGYPPDASIYSRQLSKTNPSALVNLFEPDDPDAEAHTPTDAAELVYYLEDNGVTIDRPAIVMFPGLLSAFVNRRKNDRARAALDNMVTYLRGGDVKQKEFSAPEGW